MLHTLILQNKQRNQPCLTFDCVLCMTSESVRGVHPKVRYDLYSGTGIYTPLYTAVMSFKQDINIDRPLESGWELNEDNFGCIRQTVHEFCVTNTPQELAMSIVWKWQIIIVHVMYESTQFTSTSTKYEHCYGTVFESCVTRTCAHVRACAHTHTQHNSLVQKVLEILCKHCTSHPTHCVFTLVFRHIQVLISEYLYLNILWKKANNSYSAA